MDSRDKKYASGIEKALVLFDTLNEWADYIAFLSKLHKALQQKHTTEHWIPHDLQISIRLSKCLSPNLPSGVHSKTLELYNFIFAELGIEKLSNSVNVWIPGILPIMQFASISIKPLVIDLYKSYILTLPQQRLKILVKPLLSYLLPSIDDERSDFFEASLALIDTLRRNLHDDSLLWQSVFLIIITSEERRLGCLVWCNKRLPDLNIVVPPPPENDDSNNYYKTKLLEAMTQEQKSLITPEPGLIVRAFMKISESPNILIQRGFFDLLIKNLRLNSTVLQKLIPESDLQQLIISTISAILKKDMSINRRVWNWLMGQDATSAQQLNYFKTNGAKCLIEGILKLIEGKYDHQPIATQQIRALKITLASMDRWEIGSLLIPNVFIPALKSVMYSVETKSDQYEDVLKSGSALFDSVETLIIYGELESLLLKGEVEFATFILQHFNVQDEEMMVHQLPLLLLTTLMNAQNNIEWVNLTNTIISLVPQRAYLPLEHASEESKTISTAEISERIANYYKGTELLDLPFQAADLSQVTLKMATDVAISSIKSDSGYEYLPVLGGIVDLIPELKFYDDDLIQAIVTYKNSGYCTIAVAKLLTKVNFPNPCTKIEVLKHVVSQLCQLLQESGQCYQVEIVKSLHLLTMSHSSYYIEAAISSYMLTLESFSDRLKVFNYLWTHATDIFVLDRPLHVILDDLTEANGSAFTIIQGWIETVINTGTVNTLFQLITNKLHETLEDDVVFSYHVSILYRILNMDKKKMLPLFRDELAVINSVEYKDENVSTYKDFTLFQLNRFVKQKRFNSSTFGTVLKLYELLLDGSEPTFELYVDLVFQISKEVAESSFDGNREVIINLLLNHLTELTKLLLNSNRKISSLFEKADGSNQPLIVEFLISTFQRLDNSALLSTWIDLLSTSLKFQDNDIFQFVEPISTIIINKVNELYNNGLDAKDETSISLLLNELQDVLSLFRTYVVTVEINTSKASNNDPGFFSSVAGVFNSDFTKQYNSDLELSDSRRVLFDCIRESIRTSFIIWKNSDKVLRDTTNPENTSLKYQSLKLKHKSKFVMEKLYELEPLEVLSTLIMGASKDDNSVSFKILHVLDNSRPQLTIPYIFKLLTQTVDEKRVRPTMFEVSDFLVNYTMSLQDDTIEDIFEDSSSFLKTVVEHLNSYKPILLNVLQFLSVLATKVSYSKFGSQKKVKKELSDTFLKIYPVALNFKHADISNALSSSIQDLSLAGLDQPSGLEESTMGSTPTADVIISQEDIMKSIKAIIPKLSNIVTDSDKQSSVVSAILVTLLTPSLKSKKFPENISTYQMELLNEIVNYYPNSKSLRFLLSEVFNDPKFFKIKLCDIGLWNSTLSKWLVAEPNDKILDYLTKCSQSSNNMNIFNWNDNEQLLKLLNLKRVAYMILIGDTDQHIVLLKDIFDKLDSLLQQSEHFLPEVFLIIRVIVLKFSEIHLYDYWTLIYTSLQTFFVGLLNTTDYSTVDSSAVLQACKLLDVILLLEFEDFQEWLFVIDTINAIYRNVDVVSLVDEISLVDSLFHPPSDMKPLVVNKTVEPSSPRVPSLIGVKQVDSIAYLKPFFSGLSYYNFENVYNGGYVDYETCKQDLFGDLFDGDNAS